MSNSIHFDHFSSSDFMISYLGLSELVDLQEPLTSHECERDFRLIHQNLTNILMRMEESTERFIGLQPFERSKRGWLSFFKRQRKLLFQGIEALDIHASDFSEQEFDDFLSDLPFSHEFQNPIFLHICSMWFEGGQEQVIGKSEQENILSIEQLFESEIPEIRGDDKLLLQFRTLIGLITDRFPEAYRKLMR